MIKDHNKINYVALQAADLSHPIIHDSHSRLTPTPKLPVPALQKQYDPPSEGKSPPNHLPQRKNHEQH